MIFDSLIRLPQSLPQAVWTDIEPFLKQLSAETPDGEYPLRKTDILARVMSYETRSRKEGRIEAHERYIDIQTVLAGAEEIDAFPIEVLETETNYDEQNDVCFYKALDKAHNKTHRVSSAKFTVEPGYFALFFPQDAHRPQMMIGDTKQKVKKLVIKIKRELLFV